MSIQKVAYELLKEQGRPLKPEELAKRALERGLVTSRAGTPDKKLRAMQTTLRKNTRHDSKYNEPRLVCIRQPGHRGLLLSLPEWQAKEPERETLSQMKEYVERKIQLPSDIAKQIELVRAAGIAKTFDDALLFLLRKGWDSTRPAIQAELNKFFSNGSALGVAQ